MTKSQAFEHDGGACHSRGRMPDNPVLYLRDFRDRTANHIAMVTSKFGLPTAMPIVTGSEPVENSNTATTGRMSHIKETTTRSIAFTNARFRSQYSCYNNLDLLDDKDNITRSGVGTTWR